MGVSRHFSTARKTMPVTDGFYFLHQLEDKDTYIDQATAILNEEWKRSDNARRQTLGQIPGESGYPAFCVLIEGDEVIAHAKLSECGEHSNAIVLESLIVSPSKRGT